MKFSLRMLLSFVTIFSLIYGGAHLYVYWRLVQPLKLSGGPVWVVRLGLLILFLSFPVIHFVLRRENGAVLGAANFVSSVWMGMLVYLVLGTYLYDLVRLYGLIPIPVGKIMTVIVTGVAAAITAYGLCEAHWIRVTNLPVRMPGLPAHLDGFRIAQLSDVHLGRIMRGSQLEKIVNQVNALQPDLIVITGDLVDAEPSHMEEMIPVLRRLQSRYGVFAVTGNHEFFAGVERTQSSIERAGVTLLRNRWVMIADDLQLIGRDDAVASRVTGVPTPTWDDNLRGLDRTKPAVLLYHTPVTTLAELEARGIQLQLSGHTHRGQLWPFNFIVRWIFKTPYGLFTDGKAAIYVNRGIGTWGPPIRVLARPEITLVTLTGK